jgi:hypothetical protein
MKKTSFGRGARYGFLVGIIVCVLVYIIASACLPFRIEGAIAPAYCSESVTNTLSVLTFPVSHFTNDLSMAPAYAVLPLIIYTILGAIIGIIL